MNLLFIIPGFSNIEKYQERLYNYNLPLGTLQISSFLKERFDLKTGIIDMRLEEENNKQSDINNIYIDSITESYLDILESNNIQEFQNVGINCYTSYQYQQTLIMANLIKKEYPDKKIIVGGYHPSSVIDDFNYKYSPFDYIVIDEAELSLYNLLKKPNLNKNTNKTPIILNSTQLIDVNLLPPPDYELFLLKYPYKDRFNFDLYTSRGCPYQCNFCALNYPFRGFNFEKFKECFDKLRTIVSDYNKQNPKISFADQSFFDNSISKNILDYIIQNKFEEDYKFSCQSRIETVANNNEFLKKIQKTKMIVGFGFESANKELLVEMNKTNNSSFYIESMKKILEKYKTNNNVYCRINIVCGFPGEDDITFRDTIDFIYKYALHENIQISPSLFSCYPNTPVYKNMNYYITKFGAEFNKTWWKSYSNNLFKKSVLNKPSENYTLKNLIIDYKENYSKILNVFKYKNFSDLIIWKKFYNKWYKELLD